MQVLGGQIDGLLLVDPGPAWRGGTRSTPVGDVLLPRVPTPPGHCLGYATCREATSLTSYLPWNFGRGCLWAEADDGGMENRHGLLTLDPKAGEEY